MSSPNLPAVARRDAVRLRPNAAAFFVASLLLHVAALAAVSLQPGKKVESVKWRLLVGQGRESAPLAASVARPKPKPVREIPLHVAKAMPIKPTIVERPPASLTGRAMLISRRESEVPHKPDGALPQLALGRPSLSPRTMAGSTLELPPLPADAVLSPARPRRTIAVALDFAAAEPVVVETVASASSKIASGAVNGVPNKMFGAKPAYPIDMQRRGEGGTVKLRIRVDRFGNVVAAAVDQSSGFARLDQSALRAIRSWKFEPIDESAQKAPEFLWPFEFRPPTPKPADETVPTTAVR